MKIRILLWCLFMCATFNANADTESQTVRHIVVFKYTGDASAADIDKVTRAFAELEHKIPGIESFEHGVNNSPEALNKGFTHIYQLTFTDEAARDNYLPHPEHKKFGELLAELGILDDVFVVDYAK